MPRRLTALRGARLVLVALALLGLSRLIHATDVARALAMLARAGWPLGLVLLPTLAAMMVDAWGWRAVLATLGQRVGWLGMLELRLSVEALVLALPGGSVAGEAAKVALLRRRGGVPLTVGAASLALTKLQLIASDAAYLLLIAVALRWAGWGTTSLPQRLTLAGAAFTAAAALGLGLLLHRSRLAGRLAAALARLPSRRVRGWLDAQQPRFAELDRVARAHFDSTRRARLGCFLPFLLEWIIEGMETLLIVRCLGVPLGVAESLALDGIGSLLRAVVVVVPAGLGVQDAAQVMLLAQCGVSDPIATGAAFIFVKRTKEVFWIAIGLLFLAVRRDLWRGTGDRVTPS